MIVSGFPNKNSQLLAIQRLCPSASLEHGFRSCFRNDKGPGCWLSWYNERIYFHDPKDVLRNGKDVIELWRMQYSRTFQEALYEISSLSGTVRKPRFVPKQLNNHFSYAFRKWEDYDEEYWLSTGLTIPDLEQGVPKIMPILWYDYYSKKMMGIVRVSSTRSRPIYGFVWPNGHIKTYSPLGGMKWMGNSKGTDFYYYPGNNTYMICAGGKDAKVVNKEKGYTTLSLNGERMRPPKQFWNLIKSDTLLIGYDNDSTGLQEAEKLAKHCASKGIVPYICVPQLNDWTEERQTWGKLSI